MTGERERLDRLAAGILDGEDIDWKEATSEGDPESTRSKLASLHAVEQLRKFAVTQTEQESVTEGSSRQAPPPTIPEESPSPGYGDSLGKSLIDRFAGWLAAWIERLRAGKWD